MAKTFCGFFGIWGGGVEGSCLLIKECLLKKSLPLIVILRAVYFATPCTFEITCQHLNHGYFVGTIWILTVLYSTLEFSFLRRISFIQNIFSTSKFLIKNHFCFGHWFNTYGDVKLWVGRNVDLAEVSLGGSVTKR